VLKLRRALPTVNPPGQHYTTPIPPKPGVQFLGFTTHDFRQLKVWQRAMDLVTDIYRDSADFPKGEQFGAEGAGNVSNPEFQRFLGYSLRSTYEVMTALEIAQRLGYCPSSKSQPMLKEADEIAAMLVGLSRSLSSSR